MTYMNMQGIILMGMLVLLGAGCLTVTPTNLPTTVEQTTWGLQFDLPDGWVVTQECLLNGERVDCGTNLIDGGEAPTLNYEIDPEVETISLLNTTKLPLFGGIAPTENDEAYQSSEVARINITKFDDLVDTSDAVLVEDLGQGFSKVTTCDVVVSPECQIYGQWAHDYVLSIDQENYRFDITSVGVSKTEIENVVLSVRISE